ncbi:MAG: bifunctional diaminohydroxyphosphoribosylaminopyrimidine deaminase/5-amino-6-(5-phosphoribosylamino)uracil reductase RibD [Polyangiaceae bacterium]
MPDTRLDIDAQMMTRALELARSGDPSPNPHVGCVIAQGSEIVGEGYHEAVGLEHAEIAALRSAGERAKGATLYVTLEPCNHQGRTPPCVDSILQAGLSRVVIGCRDPNPDVAGGGIERLEAASVGVTIGVLEREARALIQPWTKYITQRRSYLSLKLAVSLDGRIATRTGASKWITCAESRSRVHELRVAHDAVMIGINTVTADDPRLTVRDVPGT